MRIGIVGSEAKKFTPETELLAKTRLKELIHPYDTVVSGGCHLGGIDIWAIEEAKRQGKATVEFLPSHHNWQFYKDRNMRIARESDMVVCLTVKALPTGYKEQGFEKFCYHCNTSGHIKSGGCWTVKYAKSLGKPTIVYVIG
jgi:predicted Rossmann fold nucleotide-binding protein DprA/Smf involved in DNA uptake